MASYSDDFNAYADGPLANNAAWENTGGGGLEVFSNEIAEDPGAGFQFSSVTTATANFGDDGEAQLDIVTFTSFDFIGAGYRITTDNGYFAYAGDGEYVLSKVVAGVETELGTNATAPASGHKIKVKCSGTTISAELDTGSGFSEIISVTDSALTSGQPGACYNRQNSNGSRGDNFSAVDVATETLTITEDNAPFGGTINYVTTGLGSITTATAEDGFGNVMTLTSITDTSANIPAVGNNVQRCLTGTVTVTVGDGTNTATDTFVLDPPADRTAQTVIVGFSTTPPSWLQGFSGTVEVNDQGLYVTEDYNTVDGLGGYERVSPGTSLWYYIDETDGIMQSYNITSGSISAPIRVVDARAVDASLIDARLIDGVRL